MPFTVGDVEGHIKGLSNNQKELWVKIANKELKEGSGEGSAIRQANAAAKKATEFKHTTTHNIKEVEIFGEGTWHGEPYTTKDLDAMVEAFDEVGFQPPLKLGHNSEQEEKIMRDGQPALGWVERIYRAGDKLVADFKELPEAVFNALKEKRYKQVSSEIYFNGNFNGRQLPRVLKAVALLGADIPEVTTLKPMEFKGPTGDEDIRVIDFNVETKPKVEPKQEDKNKMSEEKVAELSKENKDLKAEAEKFSTKAEEAETKAKEATDENERLKAELSKRNADARASEVKGFTEGLVKEGKLMPAHVPAVTQILLSASDEKVLKFSDKDGKEIESSMKESLEKVFSSMPPFVKFTELSGEDDVVESGDYTNKEEAGIELDKRVKALMSKDSKLEYSKASEQVLSKDPELKKVYVGGK